MLFETIRGIIAWQFVTGKLSPYEKINEASVFSFFDAVRKGLRPSMDGIPPVMAELIIKCVHEDPSKRCAASEIAKYLEHPHLLDMDFVVPAEGSLAVPVINEETGSETALNVGADDANSACLLVNDTIIPIQPVPAEEGEVGGDRKDVATEKATAPGKDAEEISSIKEALLKQTLSIDGWKVIKPKPKNKEVRNAKCKKAVSQFLLLLNTCYCFTPSTFFCSGH